MPKINRGYASPFEIMPVMFTTVGSQRNLLPRYNPTNNYNSAYTELFMDALKFLLGGFQPLADEYKNIIDFSKPYKTQRHALRDFFQPFRGLYNISRGIACLILTALFLTIITALLPIMILLIFLLIFLKHFIVIFFEQKSLRKKVLSLSKSFLITSVMVMALFLLTGTGLAIMLTLCFCILALEKKEAAEKLMGLWFFLVAYAVSITFILDGSLSIVRGITQIITTPLSWLKIIIREIITSKVGSPKFEDSARVRKLLADYNRLSDTDENRHAREDIEKEIIRKLRRAQSIGQKTSLFNTYELRTLSEQNLFRRIRIHYDLDALLRRKNIIPSRYTKDRIINMLIDIDEPVYYSFINIISTLHCEGRLNKRTFAHLLENIKWLKYHNGDEIVKSDIKKIVEQQLQMAALAGATHLRLGAYSPAQVLTPLLMENISQFTFQQPTFLQKSEDEDTDGYACDDDAYQPRALFT